MASPSLVVTLRKQLDKHKVVCIVPTKQLDNYEFNRAYTVPAYQLLAADDVRGDAYRRVIGKLVAGKKVVEIGTGALAYLARICRDAGAEIVHAIELNESFRPTIEESLAGGRGGPIEVRYGYSTEVELPERCDVLVQQVIGTIASNEGVARTVADAKARFLRPGAAFIPAECATFVCPTSPLRPRRTHRLINHLLGGTNALSPLRMYEVLHFPTANLMAEPGELERYAFADDFPLVFDRRLELTMARDGLVDGLVFYIQIVVDREHVVTSRGENVAWPNPYLKLFDVPARVAAGDRMTLDVHVDVSTALPQYAIDVTLASTVERRTYRVSHRWSGAGK